MSRKVVKWPIPGISESWLRYCPMKVITVTSMITHTCATSNYNEKIRWVVGLKKHICKIKKLKRFWHWWLLSKKAISTFVLIGVWTQPCIKIKIWNKHFLGGRNMMLLNASFHLFVDDFGNWYNLEIALMSKFLWLTIIKIKALE